jgi:hypothetical protein
VLFVPALLQFGTGARGTACQSNFMRSVTFRVFVTIFKFLFEPSFSSSTLSAFIFPCARLLFSAPQ